MTNSGFLIKCKAWSSRCRARNQIFGDPACDHACRRPTGRLSVDLLFSALAFAVGLTLVPANSHAATLDVYAQAVANTPTEQLIDEQPLSGGTGPLVTSAKIGGGTVGFPSSAQGLARAHADYGWLGINTGAGAIGPDDFSGASFSSWGSASASWTDSMTIQSSLQTGTVRFYLILHGLITLPQVDNGGRGIAEYSVHASLGCSTGSCGIDGFGQVSYNPPFDSAIVISGQNLIDEWIFYSAPVQVIFNQPMSVSVMLSGLAQAYGPVNGGTVLANVDAYGTLTWGGFTEVRDSNGSLVTDYTVLSDSGVNWALPVQAPTPVPEPGTALMLLASLLGLIGVRRSAALHPLPGQGGGPQCRAVQPPEGAMDRSVWRDVPGAALRSDQYLL